MTGLSLAISLATIVVVVANVFVTMRGRRTWYRTGWLDGRIDLLEHMARAHTDGLPFDDFMRQVAARDGILLPEDPEDHRG